MLARACFLIAAVSMLEAPALAAPPLHHAPVPEAPKPPPPRVAVAPKPMAIPKRIEIFTPAERRAMAREDAQQVHAMTGIGLREQRLIKEAMGVIPDRALLERGQKLGLTGLETSVLRTYTGYGSEPLNHAMRYGDATDRAHWAPLLTALESGLAKLPRVTGVTYRTQRAPEKAWEVGDVVTFSGATSVSTAPKPLGEVHLVIHGTDGADISVLSAFPGEKEAVLWSPSFKVLSKTPTSTGVQIDVEQLAPSAKAP